MVLGVVIKYESFSTIDGILIGTATQGQRGPGSNANERILYTS